MERSTLSRRNFIKAGISGISSIGLLSILSGCSAKTGNPNIIFIMADDLGYGDLGCYGATKIPTPNIDRVAGEGVLFTDAHASASLCTPSRYGVLTGRYCWRTWLKSGVIRGYDPLLITPERMTVASMLKGAGYATACIGKWHLGFGMQDKTDYSKALRPGPLELGFDYFFGIPASLDMPPYCFIENDRTVGELSLEKEPYNTLQREGLMTPGWRDEEVGPTITRKALEFIDKNTEENPDRPFFIYFASQVPHTPCTPPDFIRGRSKAGVRGDMVTELDWTVGQILSKLEEHKISDNTFLIITSDNGALTTGPAAWAGDPPEKYDLVHNGHQPNGELTGQKADIWEGGHREPFIVRWPDRIGPGSTCDEPVCLTDLMATCAAIAGRELPPDAGEDSFNMLPALLGAERENPVRNAVIHHSGSGMFSIRQGEWKLVFGSGSGGFSASTATDSDKPGPKGQLYNIKEDLAEKNNLWEQNPDVVKRLGDLMQDVIKRGRSTPGPSQPNDREVTIWNVDNGKLW